MYSEEGTGGEADPSFAVYRRRIRSMKIAIAAVPTSVSTTVALKRRDHYKDHLMILLSASW